MLLESMFRRMLRGLPARVELAGLMAIERVRRTVEPELIHVPNLLRTRRRAIDIGCNNGVTTMQLLRRFKRVEAFEPNPVISRRARQALPQAGTLWQVALSSRAGVSELRIPVCNGIPLGGWASLDKPQVGEEREWQRVKVETRTLDSFAFAEVDLVKLDVEGHELEVLEGARETIASHRPWMIIEVWEDRRAAVTQLLSAAGLRLASLADLCGVPGSPQNLIFRPES